MPQTGFAAKPAEASQSLKEAVRDFWNADPCGARYLEQQNLENHARTRYALEPHIFEFADFASARGRKVLEIGVGMGADYLEWLKAGADATGIDLSSASLDQARRRCQLAGYQSDLRVGDAESLSFPDNSFDIVYSYGVLHHSPDTARCICEAWRVLIPGGKLKIMIYHHPSLTGLMLWLRYGLGHGKSLRQSVFDHLESPGTKSYTKEEAAALMQGFRDVHMKLVFSPGDLLLNQPSPRFRSLFYKFIWKLYPRWLIKKTTGNWKLFLLINASKQS